MNNNLIAQYIQLGWDLVAIPSGCKGPITAHWNQRSTQPFPIDWDQNLGIKHPFCLHPTGTLDVDELDGTRQYMADRGLDLDKYLNAPDAVQIVSGRPGRAKLLYRMPSWNDWERTRKITNDGKTLFEFRSATKSGLATQDVLPPSIHPDTGQPYTWKGDFTQLPEIPLELLNLWTDLNKPRERAVWVHSEVKDSEVEAALFAIDPDLPRDQWIQVGMSLHSFNPDAIDLFDKWSSKGAKYVGTDIEPVWDSFDAAEDGITIATLFKYARDAGWSGYIVPIEQVLGAPGQSVPPVQPVLGERVLPGPIDLAAQLHDELDALPPYQLTNSTLTRQVETILLKSITLSQAEQIGIQESVRNYTTWTRKEICGVLSQLKRRHRQMFGASNTVEKMMAEYIFVANINSYYKRESREMLKPEAFMACHYHLETDIKDRVLGREGITKVTGLKFDPSQPEMFEEMGSAYSNLWRGLADRGASGDLAPWLAHVELLVADEMEREHLLDWLAYSLQYPGVKVNHGIVLNGRQGVGKDTLLFPVVKALGRHSRDVPAGALLSDFNDFLMDCKLVIVQEPDLGNHKDSARVSNNLKSVLAAPPEELRINRKGVPEFYIRNIVSVIMLTNESDPIRISNGDRRYFVIETLLRVTSQDNKLLPGWKDYFTSLWAWMDTGGAWRHVVHYLLNRDVSGFNPKAHPPMTAAKQAVINAGYSPLGGLLVYLFERGLGPLGRDLVTIDDLQQWFSTGAGVGVLAEHGLDKLPSKSMLGRELNRCLNAVLKWGRTADSRSVRVYIIRKLYHWEDAESSMITAYLQDG